VQSLDFIAQVHEHLRPRSYLEIGVHHGRSLALSSAPSIGVDPAYRIADELTLGPNVILCRTSSAEFFATETPLAAFANPVADLAFISRGHRYEAVLPDFIAVEKHTGPGSMVIIDDVLPRTVAEAGRERPAEGAWAGDTWKIVPSLRAVRPDLILLLVRSTPTGVLLVLGADLTDADLAAAQEHLLTRHRADQEPPAEFITRSTAVYPTWVLGAPFWDVLRSQREHAVSPAEGREQLLAALQVWASTKLNDKQAKAIHPSLVGKPRPAKPAAKKASPTRPTSSHPGGGPRRVLNGVRWRLKKLVRVSKRAVAHRRKGAGA
jgi:hypothetical protein